MHTLNEHKPPFWTPKSKKDALGPEDIFAPDVPSTQADAAGDTESERASAPEAGTEQWTPPPVPETLSRGAQMRLIWRAIVQRMRMRHERRNLGNVPTQQDERKKQLRRLAVGCVAGVAGIFAVVTLLDNKPSIKRTTPSTQYKSDFRIAPDMLDKQSFQMQYDDRLEALHTRLKHYEETIDKLNARIKRLDGTERGSPAAVSIEALADYRAPDLPQEAALATGLTTTTAGFEPKGAHSVSRMGVVRVSDASEASASARASAPSARPVRRIRTAESPIAANRARNEAEHTYLPAGSFVSAQVLAGVVAPTGGTAMSNPVPMLLELTHTAQLPNHFGAHIDRCFVTASATGDLSSERVWVRLDRLSCMTREGKAIDVRVQGYATGEDGKTGVRARLVTRSGQAIANALFTGAMAGLGRAVSLSAQSNVTYSSGASASTVHDSVRAGLGYGVNDAMERIVDYYIRLADKIFPVLELDSGRRVDLVFSQGVTVALNGEDDSQAQLGQPESINHAQRFGEQIKAKTPVY